MPSPTPATTSEPPENVFGRNNDPYKIVVPTNPGRDVNLDSFVKQLNEAGEQRYKLISVVYRWQPKSTSARHQYFVPVAILKLDEVQHEYAWFETTSNTVVTIDGFAPKFDESSKRGFQLANRFLIYSYCDPENVLGTIGKDVLGQGGGCELKDLFLLQRRKGIVKPRRFIIARSPVRAGFKVSNEADLTAQIKENLAAGFYPVEVFSKWEILLTQTEETEESSSETPDLKVVMTLGQTTVRGKVNALGKQGYRLAMMNKGTAVMYRYGETMKPFAYKWLKAGDKRFAEQLAKLQADGAVYRMSYPEPPNIKNRLVFEQGPVVDGQRREYKVLALEFQVVEDWKLKNANPQVQIDLVDSSKEALNTLVNEGFVVRDLFVSDDVTDKVSVLLERSRAAVSKLIVGPDAAGEINGVVVDWQEARIVNASIVIERKNFRRTTASDQIGEFRMELPFGTYKLTVSHTHFKTDVIKKLQISESNNSVLKIMMKVKAETASGGKCPKGHLCL